MSTIQYIPSCLKLAAGNEQGTRPCIIVHGINSSANSMKTLAETLGATGYYSPVYLFDSRLYWKTVNMDHIDDQKDTLDIATKKLKTIFKNLHKTSILRYRSILSGPSYIIEWTAQQLREAILTLNLENVTIVGHSLGGLVSRCVIEDDFTEIENRIHSITTLGTPHRLWHISHTPVVWNCIPNKNIPYLVVLGQKDMVVPVRALGNLTKDDSEFNNITKIIYPELDHFSIHSRADETGIAELIKAFSESDGFSDKKCAYIHFENGEEKLRLAKDFGQASYSDTAYDGRSHEWIELETP